MGTGRALSRAAVLLALVTAFNAAPGGGGAPRPAASLRCTGARTMQPLLADWATAYSARHPDAPVQAPDLHRYSAGGVSDLLAGRAGCISFAREPFPAEAAALRAQGRRLWLIPVARGSVATPHGTFALAVIVARGNPLKRLDLAQLRALFSGRLADGRPLERWGQLGLGGAWSKRRLHLYGMAPRRPDGNPPGIVNDLDLRVLRGVPWRTGLRVVDDRPGLSVLAGIVHAVGRDGDGIGYSGFGLLDAHVRAVPLARSADAPAIAGTPASIADGRYLLARRIYLGFAAMHDQPLAPTACAFLAYVLGRAGQAAVGGHAMHFLPLTPRQRIGARALRVRACAP